MSLLYYEAMIKLLYDLDFMSNHSGEPIVFNPCQRNSDASCLQFAQFKQS